MLVQTTPSTGGSSTAASPLSNLIRTRHALAVCVACGHEHAHGSSRGCATCPDCGASVTVTPAHARQAQR